MLYLTCLCIVDSQAADDSDLEPVAYEFFTQAYLLYEEEISVKFIIFLKEKDISVPCLACI